MRLCRSKFQDVLFDVTISTEDKPQKRGTYNSSMLPEDLFLPGIPPEVWRLRAPFDELPVGGPGAIWCEFLVLPTGDVGAAM